MSLSAALVLAAAAAAPAQAAPPSPGVVFAEARVSAQILPSASIRQASGLQPGTTFGQRPQVSRRGRTVLIEFQ